MTEDFKNDKKKSKCIIIYNLEISEKSGKQD